jgi:hypothetical protein
LCRFFKFFIPAEIARREVTLATKKLPYLKKIKNRPPNTSHHNCSVEIYNSTRYAATEETA